MRNLYKNSPELFLENMPADHPYIRLYNQKKIVFCVGQGAWEYDGAQTLRNLKRIFDEKKLMLWCDSGERVHTTGIGGLYSIVFYSDFIGRSWVDFFRRGVV